MFIIELTYVKPLEEVGKYMEEHKKFLEENYEEGIFIVSGPMVPRVGGTIIASLDSKEELGKIVNKDPFIINKVSSYKITEFLAAVTGEGLESLRES